MNKMQMLRNLGFNDDFIEDVRKGKKHCEIYGKDEVIDLASMLECDVNDIESGKISGISIYKHEDGNVSYVVTEE